ncbi:MAG: holo-ACP synthase [Deinococcales bacterium]
MIVAVGIDIIELHRIEKILASRFKKRFLERTYTAIELEYCLAKKNSLPSLAARFAAKEAFQKTWFESHGWHDVWVEFEGVKPVLRVAPKLAQVMRQNKWQAHLSLSHTLENAVASVILEVT